MTVHKNRDLEKNKLRTELVVRELFFIILKFNSLRKFLCSTHISKYTKSNNVILWSASSTNNNCASSNDVLTSNFLFFVLIYMYVFVINPMSDLQILHEGFFFSSMILEVVAMWERYTRVIISIIIQYYHNSSKHTYFFFKVIPLPLSLSHIPVCCCWTTIMSLPHYHDLLYFIITLISHSSIERWNREKRRIKTQYF